MNQTTKALLLAAVMLSIGGLAVFDIIPEEVAQWAPLALLAIFPGVWLGRGRCGARRSEAR